MAFVTFITTCKNRLNHIQETMPLLYAEAAKEEIIFVDYGCTQGSSAWVKANYPKVKIVLVNDDPGFCAARARNMGALVANSPWVFFIDGDIKVKPGFVKWIKNNSKKGFYYRASATSNGALDKETWGSFLCSKQDYKTIDGYDEMFRGWGGEDDDIYARLSLSGIQQNFYPSKFLSVISHDDSIRLDAYRLKELTSHHLINQTYLSIKLAVMQNSHVNKFDTKIVKQLDASMRSNFMNNITSKVEKLLQDKDASNPYFKIALNINHWLPDNYNLLQECELTFTIKRKITEIDLSVES